MAPLLNMLLARNSGSLLHHETLKRNRSTAEWKNKRLRVEAGTSHSLRLHNCSVVKLGTCIPAKASEQLKAVQKRKDAESFSFCLLASRIS